MEELNKETLKNLGRITNQIRKEVSSIPKAGVDTSEIINFVEKKIFDLGYLPAFPCTVGINEVAAHQTIFAEGYILRKGDVIKIDFGIIHDGWITDNAFTIEVDDNKHDKLIQANLKALDVVMENIEVGSTMNDIGKWVDDVARENGFNTIHNLFGHQIARNNLHCGVKPPNNETGNKQEVTDNMELAIEPFFTTGQPIIKQTVDGNILDIVDKEKSSRNPIARKLLQYIKTYYPSIPFSKRWLVKNIVANIRSGKVVEDAFNIRFVLMGVNILKQEGIIREHKTLATIDDSVCSQFEDSVTFINNEKTIITRL